MTVPDLSEVELTASVASTVSENVTELVLEAASVAVTDKLNVPAAVGVPDSTPALDKLKPAGKEPLVAAQDHVYGPLSPPVAANVTGV